MEKQSAGRTPALSAWHEWDVPPPWVFAVGGLVLIGISILIFMKLGESQSAARIPAVPASSTPASTRPLD
jgi:hypothetical protein